MLILIIVLSILGIIGAFIVDEKLDGEMFFSIGVGIINILVILIAGIALIYNTSKLIDNRTIDNKIAIYQEENEKLEGKIETTVKGYMDFEKDAYKGVKVESYISLVNLYPELKADKLIQEQINTYQKNSEKIKDLRVKKAKTTVYKWWIYFGK